MGRELEDFKRFMERMAALNKEVVEGFDRLKAYEDQLRSGQYAFKQLLAMKVLEFIQRARVKKLLKMQSEIRGFEKFLLSIKNMPLMGIKVCPRP
ncbi:MAG: hypothetical protein PHC68_07225 [Syntrophorhabdaceae bacterium]|nr:hypothetical protein [Syntrophorhabdaceae bacterium]